MGRRSNRRWLSAIALAAALGRPPAALAQGEATEQKATAANSDAAKSDAAKSDAADEKPPPTPTLDFDLLGAPPKVPAVDETALHRRRTLLNLHQAVGLGMFGLALANTVVGQLNYSDRFASGPSTGKYKLAHQITAYGTLTAFAATGLLAVFAPNPLAKAGGFSRTTVHRISMYTATAGMAAEAVLGIWTASREGYLNQPDFAAAHLAIGYVTFAAIALGVGVIVF